MMYKQNGIWQVCAVCRYFRWAKEEDWTASRIECERAFAGEITWDEVWWYPNGDPKHFGEETGEYRGVPICELEEIDFNDELGISFEQPYDKDNPGASSTRRDGKMKRWMEEEWARVTDPAQREEFIRRNNNGLFLRMERDEFPEIGWPEIEEQYPAVTPTLPQAMVAGSAGGRQNLAAFQVVINQFRFIRDYIWSHGCRFGKHRWTGRSFSAWESVKEAKERDQQYCKTVSENIDRDLGRLLSESIADQAVLSKEDKHLEEDLLCEEEAQSRKESLNNDILSDILGGLITGQRIA